MTANSGQEPSLGGEKKTAPGAEPRLAGDRAVLHLVELLDDPDPIVRERAALALGDVGDDRAFSAIVELVRGKQYPVWQRAKKLLKNFKQPEYFETMLDLYRTIAHIDCTLVIACDRDRAFEVFKAYASSPDPADRWRAVLPLSYFDDRDGMALVIPLLKDSDGTVRYHAAMRAGLKHDPRAVPDLIAMLADDPRMDYQAATALGHIGDRRAIPGLLALALRHRTRHSSAQRWAAEALAEFKDPQITTELLKVALDRGQKPLRRKDAVVALRWIRDPDAAPALIAPYRDKSEPRRFRQHLFEAIGNCGGDEAEEFLIQEMRSRSRRIKRDALCYLLWNEDRPCSERVARLVCSVADDSMSPFPGEIESVIYYFDTSHIPNHGWPLYVFIEGLQNPNTLVRKYCIRMILHVGTSEAVIGLITAIDDPDPERRAEVIRGLAHFRWIEQRQAALALRYPEEPAQLFDSRASAALKEQLDVLIGLIKRGKLVVRLAAIDALSSFGDSRVIGPLIAAMDDRNPSIRYHVITSLRHLEAFEAVPGLITRLSDTQPVRYSHNLKKGQRVCDAAADALREIRTPEGIAALEAWQRDQPET